MKLSAHLRQLESESVFVIREAAAQFRRPVLLFSGGKDSIVLAHLAARAFAPGRMALPLVHIDTGHNFPETLAFRDAFVAGMGATLHVGSVQASLDSGRVQEESGENPSRNRLQTVTLLDTLKELGADAALGGARRDEEKARAKERFFSHRDRFGQWEPRNQRPEVWNLFNGRRHPGEHFRVFPLSNWTEVDVWEYIVQEKISVPDLYFAHEREVVRRDGMLMARSPWNRLLEGEAWEQRTVRFRTVGDATCTGAVESGASSPEEVLREVAGAQVGERGGRHDDLHSDAAMEDRKRQGYF